jgi:hypothetical protein
VAGKYGPREASATGDRACRIRVASEVEGGGKKKVGPLHFEIVMSVLPNSNSNCIFEGP